MEIKIDNTLNHTTTYLQDDDVLSLRDLQLYDQTAPSSTRSSPRASSGQEPFEFLPNLPPPTAAGDIVFLGKVISNPVDEDQYQNGDYPKLVGTSSFRLPDRRIEHVIPVRSVSNRHLGSPRHVKKVNVAALTKRRMFMFGPMKFMPEMELRSMKERQLRRTPSKMFPVAEGGDVAKKVTGTEKNQRVTCRARFNSMLDRSFACLRV